MIAAARLVAIAALALAASSWNAMAGDAPLLLAQVTTQAQPDEPADDDEPEAEPEPPQPAPRRSMPPPRLQPPPPRNAQGGVPPGLQGMSPGAQRLNPPLGNVQSPQAPPPAASADRRPRSAVMTATVTAPTNDSAVPPLDELTATRERPLFSSTRRPPPPVEESEPNAPITEAKAMSFELVGTVRSADASFAILRNTESKEETRVPKGQKFGAWTVEEIHDRSVVLIGDAKRVRMRLFDESKSPGIHIQKVGGEDDPDKASASDDDQVDEDVAPSASPEGRAATAQPVQRRKPGEMTPAQRRKARLQQRQRRQIEE